MLGEEASVLYDPSMPRYGVGYPRMDPWTLSQYVASDYLSHPMQMNKYNIDPH